MVSEAKANTGKLIVLSAPAGGGKDSIMEGLFSNEYKDVLCLSYSISATTRKSRAGEEDGKHYLFKSREEFEQLIEQGEFLEHTEYCGNYYGTLNKTVSSALEAGKNLLLKIEAEGAENVKKAFPDSLLIFVLPPSVEELRRRLINRSTESEDVIELRIKKAESEFARAGNYDYRVVNDDLQRATAEVAKIIQENING
ncbi:MAG: guanylate kinase [Oscillospiraceae bacterium]|nr:guanylate kinase [Oscillospiraceae bacterium]